MKPIFRLLGETFRRFNADRCFTDTIIISYFALMCVVPLMAVFAFVAVKFMGSPEFVARGLTVFSEDFFARLNPGFFANLADIGRNLGGLGLFGLIGALVAASFVFSNLIRALNVPFRTRRRKSFFYNRLMEYLVMLLMGAVLFLSLSVTAAWTAFHRAVVESAFVKDWLQPGAQRFINNFFVQYLVPVILGFVVLFVLYKIIPETRVHTRAAALAALVGTVLWEIFKRLFVFYVATFSPVGVILGKVLQGTLTSIIFFLLWLSASLAILLWGAELAAVVNERIDAREAAAPAASASP